MFSNTFFKTTAIALYVEMNIGKHLGGGPPIIPLPATRNGRSGFKKLAASAPHRSDEDTSAGAWWWTTSQRECVERYCI